VLVSGRRPVDPTGPDDPDAPWRRPETAHDVSHERAPRVASEARRAPVVRPRVPVVALVTTQGIIRDEHVAFASVLAALPDARIVNVGRSVGAIGGAGGRVVVDAPFEEVDSAYVVAVPGGLGLDETNHDERLLTWLRRTVPSARWVLSSSTGSVTLAAAGLLAGQSASTSWLAAGHLARHGVDPSDDRTHVSDDRIITCTGSLSAVRGALYVVEAELGPAAARQVAEALAASKPGSSRRRRRLRRWLPERPR
jgi:transcriptional regulator GlxA family with amidase domain